MKPCNRQLTNSAKVQINLIPPAITAAPVVVEVDAAVLARVSIPWDVVR